MHQFNTLLGKIDTYLGSHMWFAFLLIGTGVFYTFYLGFPQIRYFGHAIRVLRGKYDRHNNKGDTTHFQALSTALSGTIGTGNIAGVALAIHLGGPAALFWMLVTAFFGMSTKFVEVLLSHKYREFDEKGNVAGGPMYFMKKRLNVHLPNGKIIKTGVWMGGIFAVATIFSSFGTGSLPQINSISTSINTSFGVPLWLTGLILAVILGLVIIGGIQRIAKVTEKLVPSMAILYLIGALSVLIANYTEVGPAFASIFSNIFSGTAATGGFLGATFAFALSKGVGRGLFSNEAGQGSAPIAHATARANEPVSEGMVAILEPFIDTIIICTLTGVTLLSSGAWNDKFENTFQTTDTFIVEGAYNDNNTDDIVKLSDIIRNGNKQLLFDGDIQITNGKIEGNFTVLNARSVAEDVKLVYNDGETYSGLLPVNVGNPQLPNGVIMQGKSLLHSAPLTTLAFNRGLLGGLGQYIVSLGILLFAFSTAIAWSYYGDRAVTYLWGAKYVMAYRIIYVIGFFVASFSDTTIIWTFSAITIALMAIPNLIGILIRFSEVNSTINQYWIHFKKSGQG